MSGNNPLWRLLAVAAALMCVAPAAQAQNAGQHGNQAQYRGLTPQQVALLRQQQAKLRNSLGVQMGNALARSGGLREFDPGGQQSTVGSEFPFGDHAYPHRWSGGSNVGSAAQPGYAIQQRVARDTYLLNSQSCDEAQTRQAFGQCRTQTLRDAQRVYADIGEARYRSNLRRGELLRRTETPPFRRGSILNRR